MTGLTDIIAAIAVGLFPVALLYAAYSDLIRFVIPTWLSLAIVADFVVAALFSGAGITVLGVHLAIGGAVLVVCFLMYSAGLFGGGDAKLISAASVWAGGAGLLEFFLAVALIGGAFALVVLFARRRRLPDSLAKFDWVRQLHSGKKAIPYGVAICLGGLWMYGNLPLFRASWGAVLSEFSSAAVVLFPV